jgi:hypothetical protein
MMAIDVLVSWSLQVHFSGLWYPSYLKAPISQLLGQPTVRQLVWAQTIEAQLSHTGRAKH